MLWKRSKIAAIDTAETLMSRGLGPLLAFRNLTGFDCAPELCKSSETGCGTFLVKSGPHGKPTVIVRPVDFRACDCSGTEQVVQLSSGSDCRI